MRKISWLRVFGFLAGVFALLLAIVIGAVAWTFYHPERAWRFVQPLVMPKDVQTSWASWQFKAQKISMKRWHFEWNVIDFKVHRASPNIFLQFDVKFAGNVNFFDPRTEVQFENLEVISKSPGVLEMMGPPNNTGKNPFEQVESLRSQVYWLDRTVRVDKIKISVPQISVTTATHPTVKLNLDVNKPGKTDPLAVDFKGGAKATLWESTFNAILRLDQAAAGIAFLKGDVAAKGKDWQVSTPFDLALPEKQMVLGYKVKGSAGAGANPPSGTADGEASVQSNQIVIRGKSDFVNLPGGMSSVKGAEWALELPLWPGVVLSHLASHANITAPISLTFISPEVRAQLEKNCKCKWPQVLKATLDGKVWASHLLDGVAEDRPVANLNFKFEPVNNSLLVLNLAGELRVTHAKDQSFKVSPTVDATIKFPNFQAVKGWLESNRIMVPSPFDILQGSIEATIKTTLWQSDKGLVIPIDAKANLASTEQKVVLDSKINLYIPENFKSVDIMLDFTVHDFIVELPPLDPVQGFPQLTKDSRLLMQPEGSVGPPDAFKFRVMYGIRTAKPGAVRLLSKLAKPAIPVSLDLDRTARGDTLGSVRIEPFELNYLHRTMHIDQLRVIMDDRETADFAVDGRLRMEQSQYKVSIVVSGSLRSPLIKLSSEPELSRSDIVSVLLYDRTSDQLVSADRETVGSFEAAISDRAIGLLGLWVFASTPIRSFSYNALTKVYTATVQLAEGTTASIGTDWEEAAQLEVRKRVTRRWVLTASWAPSDSKEQLGKLVLQWEKRF